MQAALDGAIHHGRVHYIRPILIQVPQDAAALRNTICCSSGDNGSSDIRPQNGGISDNLTCAHFPASSTYFLARVRYHVCRAGREGMIKNHAILFYCCPHEWLNNGERNYLLENLVSNNIRSLRSRHIDIYPTVDYYACQFIITNQ